MLLTFGNDGQTIEETNYWDSEYAKKKLVYLSWNAGAARLLFPDALKLELLEMQTAKYVIVSRGRWQDQGGREGLELLFEDNSDQPYCLHISSEQTDRMLPEHEQGGGFVVTVWTREGEKLRLPGKYRKVKMIPYLAPWVGQ